MRNHCSVIFFSNVSIDKYNRWFDDCCAYWCCQSYFHKCSSATGKYRKKNNQHSSGGVSEYKVPLIPLSRTRFFCLFDSNRVISLNELFFCNILFLFSHNAKCSHMQKWTFFHFNFYILTAQLIIQKKKKNIVDKKVHNAHTILFFPLFLFITMQVCTKWFNQIPIYRNSALKLISWRTVFRYSTFSNCLFP